MSQAKKEADWDNSVAEFFIIGERFVMITTKLKDADVLSKLSTMNDKSSFVGWSSVSDH
jgi:hypothetical protein